jgi:hypothetical protein
VLRGRANERERLDGLLDRARGGESRALVVREPGLGKTALLESVVERGSGFRVARAWDISSRNELGGS